MYSKDKNLVSHDISKIPDKKFSCFSKTYRVVLSQNSIDSFEMFDCNYYIFIISHAISKFTQSIRFHINQTIYKTYTKLQSINTDLLNNQTNRSSLFKKSRNFKLFHRFDPFPSSPTQRTLRAHLTKANCTSADGCVEFIS